MQDIPKKKQNIVVYDYDRRVMATYAAATRGTMLDFITEAVKKQIPAKFHEMVSIEIAKEEEAERQSATQPLIDSLNLKPVVA